MTPSTSLDTSAFIKRFLTEKSTADMERFATSENHRLAISLLTVTEFRCVMKRRSRLGTVTPAFVQQATRQLLREIAGGKLQFHAIDGATFNLAGELIDHLSSPLGALDVIHLACAKAAGSSLMVSADRQLLRAAREAGLQTLDTSYSPRSSVTNKFF